MLLLNDHLIKMRYERKSKRAICAGFNLKIKTKANTKEIYQIAFKNSGIEANLLEEINFNVTCASYPSVLVL